MNQEQLKFVQRLERAIEDRDQLTLDSLQLEAESNQTLRDIWEDHLQLQAAIDLWVIHSGAYEDKNPLHRSHSPRRRRLTFGHRVIVVVLLISSLFAMRQLPVGNTITESSQTVVLSPTEHLNLAASHSNTELEILETENQDPQLIPVTLPASSRSRRIIALKSQPPSAKAVHALAQSQTTAIQSVMLDSESSMMSMSTWTDPLESVWMSTKESIEFVPESLEDVYQQLRDSIPFMNEQSMMES